ncbi:MAG: flagellar filament capping protein FliD [Pseudomonadota bacterium]
MVGIVSTGIGSGLDVGGLVGQLVAAEAAPAETRFARQEAGILAEVSAYGSLKSALSQFQTEVENVGDNDALLGRLASFQENDFFSVSVDSTAPPASFDLTVQSLATSQRLASGAYTDANSAVGYGQLTIRNGASAFVIAIDQSAATLVDIQDAINNAEGNTFVRATLVNADGGTTLSLSALETGAGGELTIEASGGDGGLSALTYDSGSDTGSLTEIRGGSDAIVTIDGLTVTSSSNTIGNAVEGVSIELLAADPGTSRAVSIDYDQNALRENVDKFINAYNALVDVFKTQTSFDAETNTAAALLGDSTLLTIEQQLRREITAVQGDVLQPVRSLADIGITLDVEGKATLDAETFDAAVADGFVAIGQLFSGTDGLANRLGGRLDEYLADTGPIETRTEGLNATIDDIAEQREALNERLVSLEARLLSQFNALDSLISQLSNTSEFLTQQLSQLPGSSNNG